MSKSQTEKWAVPSTSCICTNPKAYTMHRVLRGAPTTFLRVAPRLPPPIHIYPRIVGEAIKIKQMAMKPDGFGNVKIGVFF